MSDDASHLTPKYGKGLYPKEIKRKNGSTPSRVTWTLQGLSSWITSEKRAIRTSIIQTLHSTQRIRPLSTQIRIRSCTRQQLEEKFGRRTKWLLSSSSDDGPGWRPHYKISGGNGSIDHEIDSTT
ncbi:hypothetical protein PM082_011935 [Marasmius tenuissimus]|nr:hypothetical protein PM082_011935 [Marasmius tenuissimus]